MAITTNVLAILADAGRGMDDAMLLCQAMERGPCRDTILSLVGDMEARGEVAEIICAAICAVAKEILSGSYLVDYGPSAPDPYKERLGLSQKAWRRLRMVVFERDGYECAYCGDCANTVDHIIPLSRGGTNDPENLTPACKSCNSSKRDKLVHEWMTAQ